MWCPNALRRIFGNKDAICSASCKLGYDPTQASAYSSERLNPSRTKACYYPTWRNSTLCTQGMEKGRACYGTSHICYTHNRRWSIRLSSTTLRIHSLSYESRRKSGIQPLPWIRPAISGNHTQLVATPQNYQPPKLPETRIYMGTKMVTLTLQILSWAHETAHWGRSFRPDLSYRTRYQRGSSVRKSQTRWSHQTTAHPRRQGSKWSGWSQPHTPTKYWGTHGACRYSEVLEQDWPSGWVPQYQNRRRLGTTVHLPHTYGILPQSHHATRRPECSCHHGMSHVRNL